MARGDARSLAGGAVVETRLCARLLGLRILVVDGVVTLWPAQATQAATVAAPARRVEPSIGEPAGGRLGATAHRLEGNAERLRALASST
jgi:hypothetical protein